jgi:hypothetical protein
MNALTTPEVLRLLEGGNESALAKWNREAALAVAVAVIDKTEGEIEWGGYPQETRYPIRAEISSEVVTRALGKTFHPEMSFTYQQWQDRPAIVISTQ